MRHQLRMSHNIKVRVLRHVYYMNMSVLVLMKIQ